MEFFRNQSKYIEIKNDTGFDGSWAILYHLIEDTGSYNLKLYKVILHWWKRESFNFVFYEKINPPLYDNKPDKQMSWLTVSPCWLLWVLKAVVLLSKPTFKTLLAKKC